MKRTTSQWRSVSSATPFCAAIASAIRSFHWCASMRKPSPSTSTGASAIRVVVMSSSFSGGNRGALLACRRHRGADPGDLAAGQEGVPVDPLEGELAEVVEPRLLQEREPESRRKVAGQRLDVVVEVDQQRLWKPVSM